jgi:hypothetical protein
VLDEAGARAIGRGAPLATDDHNLLATHSPRVLASPIGSVDRLLGPHDPLLGRSEGLDPAYLVRRLALMKRLPRAERIANGMADPLERLLAQTELAVARREPRKALDLAQRALALAPDSTWARYRVGALSRRLSPGAAAPADATLATLAEAQRLRDARDWAALARLEVDLAALALRHPGYADAEQLRVDWRLGQGSAESAREALGLLDADSQSDLERTARRALAGAASQTPGVAVQSLDSLAKRLGPKARLSPLATQWALAAIDTTPGAELPPSAGALRQRLGRERERAELR